MMKILELLFDLQLFADGGDGAGGSASSSTGDGAAVGDSSVSQQSVGDNGQDATANNRQENKGETQDRAEQYKKFRADFKAEYDSEVQAIVEGRLKKLKNNETVFNAYKQKADKVFDALATKYGEKSENVDSILSKLEQDNSFYAEQAEKKGMSIDEYKNLVRLQKNSQELQKIQHQKKAAQEAQVQYQKWSQEAKTLKDTYPNLNLKEEVKNPNFTKLLKSGVDMATVYNVIHQKEITAAAMKYAANKTAGAVANAKQKNANRPSENGIGEASATVQKTSINNLTRKQMQEMKDRARRGEKISFS